MLDSVSGTKITSSVVNKSKNNQISENLTKNKNIKEEKQKFSYPNSALQKAYFLPSFAGSVTDVTSRIEERKAKELENPTKGRKSLDGKGIKVDLKSEAVKIDELVNQAIQITKDAKIISTNGGFPFTPEALAARTEYKSTEDYKAWFTVKKDSRLYLYIKTDEMLNPDLIEESFVKIPLSKENGQRLAEEANKKFSADELKEFHTEEHDLTNLITDIRNLTDEGKLQWNEFRDHDNILSFRTKYKNYNIDLLNNPVDRLDVDEEGYDQGPVKDLSIGISKVGKSKKEKPTILIFDKVNIEEADRLQNSLLQSGSYEPYMPPAQQNSDEKYFKEMGFLKLKTKKEKEKFAQMLEGMGFVRKQEAKGK